MPNLNKNFIFQWFKFNLPSQHGLLPAVLFEMLSILSQLCQFYQQKSVCKYLLLLILVLMHSACTQVALRGQNIIDQMVDGVSTLNEDQIGSMSGFYRLMKMELVDHDDGSTVIFSSGYAIPVFVDSRSTFFYVGVKTGIMLDSNMSFLNIDSQNVCTFQWSFDSSNKKVNPKNATIGEMKITGKSTMYGCIKEKGFADLPSHLMPFKGVKYLKDGDLLKVQGTDGTIRQTLYYVKVRTSKLNAFGIL